MKSNKKERKVYEQPEVVYEGKISTRAGSAPRAAGDDGTGNLFGDQ